MDRPQSNRLTKYLTESGKELGSLRRLSVVARVVAREGMKRVATSFLVRAWDPSAVVSSEEM